jgi:protein required for attachment to host cells
MGFEIGKTVAGYEILEVLGGSKTGVAYKVRNVFAQRIEVLKILPKNAQDDEEQVARFLREIAVHARLVHPNIVTFYNASEVDGQLVMTTEFVPGITVAERLEAGPIAWRDAFRYASDTLSALEYAHASGVIHRGLSSSNLVITTAGIVRLHGFGLAKSASDPDLTAVGMVIGALRYISPEQVKGVEVDERCDIYSLGVVMYEMLAGKLPFESKSQFELMLAHVNTPPRHVSDVNPEVPREAGDAVMKALAKEPDQRFRNAREFRAKLERIARPVEETTPVAEPAMVEISAVSAHEAPVLPEVAAVEAREAGDAAVKALQEVPDWSAEKFRAELESMLLQPVQQTVLLTAPVEPAAAQAEVVSDSEAPVLPEVAAVEAREAGDTVLKALEEEPDWRAEKFRAELESLLQPVQEKVLLTAPVEPAAAEIPVASAHEVPAEAREADSSVLKAVEEEPDWRFQNQWEFSAELERMAQPVQETMLLTAPVELAVAEVPIASAHEVPAEAHETNGSVLKALEEEPDWRFQEARDFRAELDHTAQPVRETTLLTERAAVEVPGVSAHEVAAWPGVPAEQKVPQPAPIAAAAERPTPGLPQPLAAETELPISFLAHLLNSKLGLSLAACVLTVIMGSVMLLALLIAKP